MELYVNVNHISKYELSDFINWIEVDNSQYIVF